MQAIRELAALIARHAPTDGQHETAVPGLWLVRASAPTQPLHTVHVPAVGIIAQGSKMVTLGETAYHYGPAKFLTVSVDVPMCGSVLTATPEEPYLSFRLDLDRAMLASLNLELPGATPPARPRGSVPRGVFVSDTTAELAEVAVRLLRLLDTPQDIMVLAPLVVRELHYRLLTSEQADVIRYIACGESRVQQITRATVWIREHYNRPFSIERLASEVGMSPSTLHEHFKTVTGLSPLQYQKQMRLQEARRLMLTGQRDAAGAAHAVGYESSSQFSREYTRFFGLPPGRDAMRLRQSMLEGGPSVLQVVP
ncbi:AraC family transcriptional regulator [Massilia sp. KIM]|uniref:AraC family transcriptional regulator n=1 Tax=Massilia sp. KIM TaxID=1955422 RepID=UPI00098FB3F4|nr:AraC family transcriptional regulator [Massilia sp. KIM]OON59140.1 AraC family transcriptional regulator [Massilia sp. KIM]